MDIPFIAIGVLITATVVAVYASVPKLRVVPPNGVPPLAASLFIGQHIASHAFVFDRTDGLAVLNEGLSTGNMISIAFTMSAFVYLAGAVVSRRFDIRLMFHADYAALTFCILVYAVSCLYSSVPLYSLYRIVELATFVVLAVAVFSNMKGTERYISLFAWWMLAWWVVMMPAIVANSSAGLFSAAKDNIMPAVCVFNIVFLFDKITRLRGLLLFPLAFATFVLAGSASSTAALISGASVPLIASKNMMFRIAGLIVLAVTLTFDFTFLIAPEQFPAIVDELSNLLGKPAEELAKATGRYTIWGMLWEGSNTRYFGSGFGMERFFQFFVDPAIIARFELEAGAINDVPINLNSAHNSLLSAWVSAGFFGVAAILIMYVSGVLTVIRSGSRSSAHAAYCLLFLILNSFTTPGVGGVYSPMWIAWVAVVTSVRRSPVGVPRPAGGTPRYAAASVGRPFDVPVSSAHSRMDEQHSTSRPPGYVMSPAPPGRASDT